MSNRKLKLGMLFIKSENAAPYPKEVLSNTAKKMTKKLSFCPKYKLLCLGQITEYHSSYFQAWWWLDHVMGMLVIGKDKGVFHVQTNLNTAISTGKILEEHLVQSVFYQ